MPPSFRVSARVLRALSGFLAAAILTGWAAGPAQAGVAGDHHSPAVVMTATSALAAQYVLAANATAGTLTTYIAARDAAADSVAFEMGLDPAAVRDAWSRADMPHQTAVLAALTELGKPYRYATSDPDRGFDCSGLTAYAWALSRRQHPPPEFGTDPYGRSPRQGNGHSRRHRPVPRPRHALSRRRRRDRPRREPTRRRRARFRRAPRALRQPDPLSSCRSASDHRRSISAIRVVQRLHHAPHPRFGEARFGTTRPALTRVQRVPIADRAPLRRTRWRDWCVHLRHPLPSALPKESHHVNFDPPPAVAAVLQPSGTNLLGVASNCEQARRAPNPRDRGDCTAGTVRRGRASG